MPPKTSPLSTKPRRRTPFNRVALLSLALPFLFTGCEQVMYEVKLDNVDDKYMSGQISKKEFVQQYKQVVKEMEKSPNDPTVSEGKKYEHIEKDHFALMEKQLKYQQQDQDDDNNSDADDMATDLLVNALLGGNGGGGKAMAGKAHMGKVGKMGKVPTGKMGKAPVKGGKAGTNAPPKKGSVPPKKS